MDNLSKIVGLLSILTASGLWASPEALLERAQTVAQIRACKKELKEHPDQVVPYGQDALACFEQLCHAPHGPRLLRHILQATMALKENGDTIRKTSGKMIPEATEYAHILNLLWKKGLTHIDLLCTQKQGYLFLRRFLKYRASEYISDLAHTLFHPISHWKNLNKVLYGPQLIKDVFAYLTTYNTASLTDLQSVLKEDATKYSAPFLWTIKKDLSLLNQVSCIPKDTALYCKDIYSFALWKAALAPLLESQPDMSPFDILLQEVKTPVTPTQQHMHKYFAKVIQQLQRKGIYKKYLRSPALVKMGADIIAKEESLQDTHYTFLHGQDWRYHLYNRWFTKIWEIQHHKKLDNFYFLRVKQMPQNNRKQYKMRKKMIANSHADDADILWMNRALFAHPKNKARSTAYYIAENYGSCSINFEHVFQSLNSESLYEKYKEDLQRLEKRHKKLNKHGNAVLVAVPKAFVEKSIFCMDSHSNEKPLLYTLQHYNDPSYKTNSLRFCLCLTTDQYGGLNPDNGIQIHMFHPTDPEEYAAFLEDEQELFEKIATDIRLTIGQKYMISTSKSNPKVRAYEPVLDNTDTASSAIKTSSAPLQTNSYLHTIIDCAQYMKNIPTIAKNRIHKIRKKLSRIEISDYDRLAIKLTAAAVAGYFFGFFWRENAQSILKTGQKTYQCIGTGIRFLFKICSKAST